MGSSNYKKDFRCGTTGFRLNHSGSSMGYSAGDCEIEYVLVPMFLKPKPVIRL